MTENYVYNGSGRVWYICSWERGPICYGMIFDLVGAFSLFVFMILIIGIIFFGWFGIFPKAIRRKLHE